MSAPRLGQTTRSVCRLPQARRLGRADASAVSNFVHGAGQRSPHRRAMAFAAIGAGELLAAHPRHFEARKLLVDALDVIGSIGDDPAWPWPDERLSYANAALAEALVVCGHLLGRDEVLAGGLSVLRWLLDRQTVDGHLSAVTVGRPPLIRLRCSTSNQSRSPRWPTRAPAPSP